MFIYKKYKLFKGLEIKTKEQIEKQIKNPSKIQLMARKCYLYQLYRFFIINLKIMKIIIKEKLNAKLK